MDLNKSIYLSQSLLKIQRIVCLVRSLARGKHRHQIMFFPMNKNEIFVVTGRLGNKDTKVGVKNDLEFPRGVRSPRGSV